MPVFMDQHDGGIPPEMVGPITEKVNGGQADQFGSKALNVYWSDSETFCLSEAPDAESVHKSHQAIGINLEGGAIRQVNSAV